MSAGARTPPIIVLLAVVVTVAVWFAWSRTRREASGELLHTYWEERLPPDEIRRRLADPETPTTLLRHALVQLQRLGREGQAMNAGATIDDLKRLAASSDRTLRWHVAMATTYLSGPQAEAILLQLLGDEDDVVALDAAIGLAARGNPAGADRITAAIGGTRGDQIEARRELLRALRHVAQPRHRDLLLEQLRRAELDGDDEAASWCREALTRLGD